MDTCGLNPFSQTDLSHLSSFEKETLFIDRIGYIVSRFIAAASFYACATSSSPLLVSISLTALISLVAYKMLFSRFVPQEMKNDFAKLLAQTKPIAKEACLIIYCKALKIFSSTLNRCRISNHTLNQHYFKVKALKEYARAISQGSQKFQKYLKVSVTNSPKLKHVLNGSYLEPAKKYLLAFSQKYTKEKIQTLCQHKSDKFCEKYPNAKIDGTGWAKHLVDKENEWSPIPEEKDLRRPKGGICIAAVATIFKEFITSSNALEKIVSKYKDGFGKSTAGLQSLHNALWSKRILFPKSVIFHESPECHIMECLNIKRSQETTFSFHSPKPEDDLEKMTHDISKQADGNYEIQLATFKDSDIKGSVLTDATVHSILFIKQPNSLQIVDPNIGLLVANESEDIQELIGLLLLYYAKKNQHLQLDAYSLLKK